MKIHFSILGVILFCALIWEPSIRYDKLNHICSGKRYDNKSQLIPWMIVFGYIAFLAAMRSGMNDTSVYINSFNQIPGSWNGVLDILTGNGKDKAFNITANIFKMYISSDYHLWFGFFSVIESCIFIYMLRRESVSFLDSCYLLFSTTLYYNYFSMMRQWFSVLLLFLGGRLIKEEKVVPYIVLCIIAAQYHESAYFFIPVYFITKGKAWSYKQNLILGISIIVVIFLNPILTTLQSTLEGTTYDYAINAMAESFGSSGIRAIIAAVPVVIAFLGRSYIDENNKMINVCVNMSMINFLLNFLATFTSGLFVVRLATYTNVYNLILYPYLLNVTIAKDNQKIIKIGFYILFMAFYCYQMTHQGAWGYVSNILGDFN